MIKENAPVGATHYQPYTGQYLKCIGTYWYLFREGKWHSIPHYPFSIESL